MLKTFAEKAFDEKICGDDYKIVLKIRKLKILPLI